MRQPGVVQDSAPHMAAAASAGGARGTRAHRFPSPPHLGDLGAAVDVTLYRIVQEALTNVVRHAKAATCHLEVDVQGGDLHLEVRDDGVGLPSPVRLGVGLRSMRERAADVGGRVDWMTDGGTVVRVSVPVSA